MTKNYKILGKYIKDMSSETPDIETYIFVKDYISKYQLNIDINSKALKNKMIEVNTILRPLLNNSVNNCPRIIASAIFVTWNSSKKIILISLEKSLAKLDSSDSLGVDLALNLCRLSWV